MTDTTFDHCTKHPTTGTFVLTGQHLSTEVCWESDTCRGCLPCATHNPRPIQRPASTTDARKRLAESTPAPYTQRRTCGCGEHEITHDGIQVFDGPLIHQEGLCTAPTGQEPRA